MEHPRAAGLGVNERAQRVRDNTGKRAGSARRRRPCCVDTDVRAARTRYV